MGLLDVDAYFREAQKKEEAQQHGQKRVSKWIEKLLNLSGKNNGSQAHEINKWALRKQMGLKEPREIEVANPWVACDVEK